MKITELCVNHIAEPKGFCYDSVSFSWKVEEGKDAKEQKYARITVKKGEEIIYDSGMDEDADSLDYPVQIELEPRCRYDWTVSVMTNNGETAENTSCFETGKLHEAWTAQWITPGEEISKPNAMSGCILEKNFEVRDIKDARLYICGLGVYECYINLQKVGEEYPAPGYHSYDFHLQTGTYDISEYLTAGENRIEIWLGEGWFKSRLGFDGGIPNLYGDKLYAIAEIYGDGRLLAATGEDWISRESPIVKKEFFKPIELLTSPKGETILDFGQNLTGWVEFESDIPDRTQIRLTACEILQDGCFYHDNLRLAKTEFIYISNGKKKHVRPHFTFYGFRYMLAERKNPGGEWEALEEDCGKYDFTAHHLRSDFDQIGWIKTGNEKVNQLYANAMWGQWFGKNLDAEKYS